MAWRGITDIEQLFGISSTRLEDGGGDKTNILPVAGPLRLNASGSASKGRAARAGGSRVALLTSYSVSPVSET